MFLDCEPKAQPPGTTREVWNMLYTKLRDAGINEPGFQRVASETFPTDGQIVGQCKLPTDEVIYFLKRGTVNLLDGAQQISVVGGSSWNSTPAISSAGNFVSNILYQPLGDLSASGLQYHIDTYLPTGTLNSWTIAIISIFTDNSYSTSTIASGFGGTRPNATGTITLAPGAVKVGIQITGQSAGTSAVQLIEGTFGGKDEIGVLSIDNVYTKYVGAVGFNFDVEHPIKAVATYDSLGSKIVAFSDFNEKPRIINLDVLPFTVNANKDVVTESNLNNILLFPESNEPSGTASTISGSLLTGAYFACVAYEDYEGTRTEFHTPIGPFFITDENDNSAGYTYNGVAAGSPSGKGLKFTITGLDTRYPKIVLAIISKIGGQYSVKAISDIYITSTTTVVYTGSEIGETLTLAEVLTKQPNYNKVKDLLILNDRIYGANLEVDDEIDYQSLANNIVLNYRVGLKSITDKDTRLGNNTTFMAGQVVAVYIRWKLKNGKVSKAFHIPGRTSKTGETSNSSFAVSQDIRHGNGNYGKKYQIEDTCNANSQVYTLSNGEYSVTDKTKSNLGYWENENEVYPTGFPTLAGSKVRHHVMPTIQHLKNTHYSASSQFGKTEMPRLTLDVSNVLTNSELTTKAIGWEILAAVVTPDNANVLTYDLLLYSHNVTRQSDDIVWSLGSNMRGYFRQAGESDEGGGDWRDLTVRRDYIRCHSMDLLMNKPNISPAFIRGHLSIEKSSINNKFETSGKSGGRLSLASEGNGQISAAVVDNTDSSTNTISAISASADVIKKITYSKYLPPNVVVEEGSTKIATLACEEALVLKLGTTTTALTVYETGQFRFSSSNQEEPSGLITNTVNNGSEKTYLISIHQLFTDLYNSFSTQLLYSCHRGKYTATATSSATGLQGDCFIGTTSFITGGPRITDLANPLANGYDNNTGILIVRQHATMTRNNTNMRHENPSIPGSKYYPVTPGTRWILSPDTDGSSFIVNPWEANVYEYNSDYSSVNDLTQSVIYKPNTVVIDKFPNRVIRSSKFNRNGKAIGSFRTFLEQDYYESNFDRGEIINLTTMDDVLFIHHRYGLFRTIGKETLKGSIEITLGSRDIFDMEPKEQLQAEQGYLGNAHQFGTLTFKGGYVFCDGFQGKVFMIARGGSVVELSAQGLRNEFIDILKGFTTDNPYNDEGIQVGFDEKHNRLLFSIVKEDGYTLSYSFDTNSWISYHNYIPKVLTSLKTKVLSCGIVGEIHQHNDDSVRGKYYDETVYPSTIGLAQSVDIDALFTHMSWRTLVYDTEINRDLTFDKIQLRNGYQDTGEIALVPFTSIYANSNVRKMNNYWNFNKFRTPDSYPKNARMVDTFIEAILTYNNTPNLDNSQNTLYLYEVDFHAIKAER